MFSYGGISRGGKLAHELGSCRRDGTAPAESRWLSTIQSRHLCSCRDRVHEARLTRSPAAAAAVGGGGVRDDDARIRSSQSS